MNEPFADVPTLWWMSFCDPEKPKGEQFLGGLCLEVPAGVGPITHSWAESLNPGGEAMIWEIEDDAEFQKNYPASARNRLLTRAECEAL